MPEKSAEYDPKKPFTAQVRQHVESTWTAAERWNIDIRQDGKRTAFTRRTDGYPWNTPGLSEADFVDGIGTKAMLHWLNKTFAAAAQDASAMTLNDAAEHGFVPYRMQDHLCIETDDKERGEPAIFGLTAGLADVCKKNGIILVGGETAVLNTLQGFEMGTIVNAVQLHKAEGTIEEGDVLIGLESSGTHSNGLTFIRAQYLDRLGMHPEDKLEGIGRFIDEFTRPTVIYLSGMNELHNTVQGGVLAGLHISGGGWSKYKELIPSGKKDIRVKAPQIRNPIFLRIFEDSQGTKKPLTPKEMYTKFNCGIGYVVAVEPEIQDQAMEVLKPFFPVVLDYRLSDSEGTEAAVSVEDSTFAPGELLRL